MHSTDTSTSNIPSVSLPPTASSDKSVRIIPWLPYLTVGVVAVCSFISSYGMEFLGDDLNHGIRTAEKFPHWYQWPLAIPYQWLTGNGRFGDMIGNILLAQAPMWLLASLSAIMDGAFYLLAMKMSFPMKKEGLPRLLVLAVIMFAFPWWDSFFLFVCRINYTWTSALTLLTLWISLFRQKEIKAIWCCLLVPLALAAGWGHEACGMPAVVGILVYFYFGRSFKKLPEANRWILTAFIIGSLLSITSPCSYSRLGSYRTPDDTITVLLLKSSSLVLILLLAVAAAWCFESSRKKLISLCRTPWIVLAVAAVCSMAFVVAGGIVGRSGFFSQTYALVALGILFRTLTGDVTLSKGGVVASSISGCLFLIMTAHECGVCLYQFRSNLDLRECRRLYEESSDGVVYASPIQRNEFPWWTLNKNKACIDNDDAWLIETYDLRLGHGQKHYRLLPEELRHADVDKHHYGHSDSDGWIATAKPAGTSASNRLIRDGVEYTVVEYTADDGQNRYFISPRIVDPGDR